MGKFYLPASGNRLARVWHQPTILFLVWCDTLTAARLFRHLPYDCHAIREIMLKTVATYTFPYEAQISRAKLDSEGIPAFIADELTINMQWLYSNALGGVRLQVPEVYVEQALSVLSQDGAEALEREVGADLLVCSECGSTEIVPFQKGRRWAFLVFLGLDFPLFPFKNTMKCNNCGHVEGA